MRPSWTGFNNSAPTNTLSAKSAHLIVNQVEQYAIAYLIERITSEK